MAIIKYQESFYGTTNWVWEHLKLNECPVKKTPRIIDKKKALAIIEQEGLMLVHESKFGKVWDTPDEAYKERWQGTHIFDIR